MDHRVIDEQNIAERYVADKLSEQETADFEEHYLDCAACIERVEDAERLQRGLERVAEQEAMKAVQLGILGRLATWSRSRQAGLVAMLLLLVAVLPAGLQYRQLRQARLDLEQTRGELADVLRPQTNTAIFALSPFRGGGPIGSGPVNQISLSAEPEWIVLSLEPEGAEYPAYRATLLGAGGESLWEGSRLELALDGTVTLSFYSESLETGDYLLRLEGLLAGAEPVRLARYPLRVAR